MRVPFVDLRASYEAIRSEVLQEWEKVFEDTSFIMGPALREFEQAFALYCGVGQAVGVGNGTDAITLALKALGIGAGDRVVVPVNTFIATAEAVANVGAVPVFVDVLPDTYNMDAAELEEFLASHQEIRHSVKAVIPVHLYGQPADMDAIMAVAERYGLYVIEDACQAHGATYQGKKAGSTGQAGCFSFYPAKNLGAFGDGGAVVTDDAQVALAVRKLRDHGGVEKYQHDLVGYNSRLDTLQAAVLLVKLKYLDQWNERRRQNARLYDELLAGVPGIVTPAALDGVSHVYHLYVIRLERGDRDELRQYLAEAGIGAGIHYPAPLHLTPAFSYLGYRRGDFPVAEDCADRILSLPMYPEMSREQVEYVAECVSEYMKVRA